MVIVLISTTLRADADRAAYDALGAQMSQLVETIPGFLGAKDYVAEDGDAISMVTFESHDALRAWREHPDHVVAQRRGKDEIYASYRVEVCEVVRAYDFTAPRA